jgi:hypothetical protein
LPLKSPNEWVWPWESGSEKAGAGAPTLGASAALSAPAQMVVRVSRSRVVVIILFGDRDFRRGGLKMIQDECLGEQFRQDDRLVWSRSRIEHV